MKKLVYNKGGLLKKYAGGGAMPWGEIINAGNSIGDATKGGEADTTKNYFGNWAKPTHTNIIESFSSGDINEIGDNVFTGGLFGFSARRQSKEANAALQTQLRAQKDAYTQLGEQRLAGYDMYGNQAESSFYALGGQLKQLNSDTVEVDGNTHAQGGVQLPETGAEVEDKETISGDYVFSEQLGFAQKHKEIAKQIGNVEKKPINTERKNTLMILRGKEQALKNAQEAVKSRLFDSQNGTMLPGGKRTYADGGQISTSALTEGVPTSFQLSAMYGGKDPYAGSAASLGYTPDFSSLPSNTSLSVNDQTTASNSGSGFNWGQALGAALPYVTNAINANRKLPLPPSPVREQPVRANLVNYDADRAALDRSMRGINKGLRYGTSNPGLANAITASSMGSYLDTKAKLSQAERNTNAQIMNQNSQFNSSANMRNVMRDNDYLNSLTARTIAQQNLMLENSADASNKGQQQMRDYNMMGLENRKLDILPQLYKDSGVVDRNLMDQVNNEKYPRRFRLGGKMKGWSKIC